MKEVKILGHTYEISEPAKRKDSNLLMALSPDTMAAVDYNSKEIHLCQTVEGDPVTDEFNKQNLIHELAHAIFYESGRFDMNTEENVELVRFVHEQLTKIMEDYYA